MPAEDQSCVATFIAAAPTAELTQSLEALRAALPGAGAVQWLDEARAVDVTFTSEAAAFPAIWRACQTIVPGQLDIVLQPQAHRRKKLLLADMDSTMIEQECVDELADFAGLKPQVAAITDRAMRGEIAFEPALRERVALLEGLPASVIDEVLQARITSTPGARVLVQTMRAHGGYCCLVSGGFTLFTAAIAARLGFDENRGNELIVEDERLAGTVGEPILGREAKRETLKELRDRLKLAPSETLAIGDGANDLGMIGEAGLGVAYRAKPAVAAAAHARIDHADLTAVLFAQGYRREEFVTA